MRKAALSIAAALLVLIIVVAVRTAAFTLDPVDTPPGPEVKVDADAAAEHLAAALRFETISRSTAPRSNPEALAALRDYMARTYPKVHAALNVTRINTHSLLYTWRGSEPSAKPVLLMAHLDVVPVPPSTLSAWTHPPFAGVIADGYIWGRGALDVKSGALGILEAAEMLLANGFSPKRTIYFGFGHDEEIGGKDGARQIASHLKSAGVELEMVLDEGGMITQGIVPGVPGPIALVGIAEKGYVSLDLSVATAGGHSSMPPKQTSVGILAAAIGRLEANPFPTRMDHSSRFFEYVGPKMPLHQRVIFANLWLFGPIVKQILGGSRPMNASMRTTAAATMFSAGVKDNVLPVRARAVVNFRIIPGDTVDSVKDYVTQTINDDRITLTTHGSTTAQGNFSSNPSPVSDITSKSYALLGRSIRQVARDPDMVVAPYLVLGATDSRYFTGLSKNVYRFLFNRIGKDDVPRIHGKDERVRVDNYAQTVEFYYRLMSNTREL